MARIKVQNYVKIWEIISVCPDGYAYVGDDNSTQTSSRDVWMEEADRTETYSCYKIFKEPKSYLEATRQCQDDKGQLVSLQNLNEAARLKVHFFDEGYYDKDDDHDDDSSEEENDDREATDAAAPVAILTSGLNLEGKWIWFGTSKDFRSGFIHFAE